MPIENVPRYELLAEEFAKRFENGSSVSDLARDFKMSWQEAKQILNFAQLGKRPVFGGRKPARQSVDKAVNKQPKYKLIADDVVHMKDEQRISFTQICRWLNEHRGIIVSYDTVVDTYEYGRRQRGLPIAPKDTPERRRFSRIPETTKKRIRERLAADEKVASIARDEGVSIGTVYLERGKLKE